MWPTGNGRLGRPTDIGILSDRNTKWLTMRQLPGWLEERRALAGVSDGCRGAHVRGSLGDVLNDGEFNETWQRHTCRQGGHARKAKQNSSREDRVSMELEYWLTPCIGFPKFLRPGLRGIIVGMGFSGVFHPVARKVL